MESSELRNPYHNKVKQGFEGKVIMHPSAPSPLHRPRSRQKNFEYFRFHTFGSPGARTAHTGPHGVVFWASGARAHLPTHEAKVIITPALVNPDHNNPSQLSDAFTHALRAAEEDVLP